VEKKQNKEENIEKEKELNQCFKTGERRQAKTTLERHEKMRVDQMSWGKAIQSDFFPTWGTCLGYGQWGGASVGTAGGPLENEKIKGRRAEGD